MTSYPGGLLRSDGISLRLSRLHLSSHCHPRFQNQWGEAERLFRSWMEKKFAEFRAVVTRYRPQVPEEGFDGRWGDGNIAEAYGFTNGTVAGLHKVVGAAIAAAGRLLAQLELPTLHCKYFWRRTVCVHVIAVQSPEPDEEQWKRFHARRDPDHLLCLVFCSSFVIGNVFGFAFWQAGMHAEEVLDGKPLPGISEFFILRYDLPGHLALLPWLGLTGAPLLMRSTKDYWDSHSFALRYLAFLSVELLFFIVLLFALALPFIPHYIANFPERRQSSIELVVGILFWLGTALLGFLAVRRIHKISKNSQA